MGNVKITKHVTTLISISDTEERRSYEDQIYWQAKMYWYRTEGRKS